MKSQRVNINKVYLDPNNFRLHGHQSYRQIADADITSSMIQKRTFNMLVEGERREGIRDLLESFRSNGILRIDNILVKTLEDGSFLVIEGNRRVATMKALLDDFNQGFDTGAVSEDFFRNRKIDVVVYDDALENRQSHLLLMGLRHVTKVKDWGEFEQSELVHDLHIHGKLDFSEISERLGIGVTLVKRHVNTFVAMILYKENQEFGDQFTSKMAPIFHELMGAPRIREWLEWDENQKLFKNSKNLDRFYSWMSVTDSNAKPVIQTRDDVRIVKKIIDDSEALQIMEDTSDIQEAYDSSMSVTKEGVTKALRQLRMSVEKITISAVTNMDNDQRESLLNIIDTFKAFQKLIDD